MRKQHYLHESTNHINCIWISIKSRFFVIRVIIIQSIIESYIQINKNFYVNSILISKDSIISRELSEIEHSMNVEL